MTDGARLDGRLPIYAAVAAVVVMAPMVVSNGIESFALSGLLLVLASGVLFIIAVRKRGVRALSLLLTALVFVSVCWSLGHDLGYLHPRFCWIVGSRHYKQQLQIAAGTPGFAHIEWDAWGFAGADTSAYLVFDPDDSLAGAASHGSRSAKGIPCPFYRVLELEPHYYAVTYYTDTSWDRCGP